MSGSRETLYARLPEIYHIRDGEQSPSGQLRAFLDILDSVPAGLRDNIEALYHDLFIDTCDDWVIPYLADLLGTSHLSGDAWTLRADVARTLFHRRRKGTLGAVESLAYTLSGWAARAVELRDNLAWSQHLNHQRPDGGGIPPLQQPGSLTAAVRGGTLPIRDPAGLSFINGPFDPFAHIADFKPGQIGTPHYNLPNLGVYLWRLEDYRVPLATPGFLEVAEVMDPDPDEAPVVLRCSAHPQGDPMVLFNTFRYRMDEEPPLLAHPDEVPGPIPWPRLTSGAESAAPEAYVRVAYHALNEPPAEPGADSPGLILHLPDSLVPPPPADDPELDPALRWRFRGANLCAWEAGLSPKLGSYEIAIDPERGRLLFGLNDRLTEADPLAEALLLSYTYGFSGPTGAHPLSREPVEHTGIQRGDSLEQALANLQERETPLVLEIQDSATYGLDLSLIEGAEESAGVYSLLLASSLTLRAATGQRPVIRLRRPLRFRPATLGHGEITADAGEDPESGLSVTLEGLYITWDRSDERETDPELANPEPYTNPGTPLIARVALDLLRIEGCTLDPGGAWQLDGTQQGTRQARRPGFALSADYGFDAGEVALFDQVPKIELIRCISGALLTEGGGYACTIADTIIDGYTEAGWSAPPLAIGHTLIPETTEPETTPWTEVAEGWGPSLVVYGLTCFGRARVTELDGEGGIWLHRLQVQRHQQGCIRYSYFSGIDDRLPPHLGCVNGLQAPIAFSDLRFGMPDYAQLARRSDARILEQGPGRDLMGAFGYLRNTHKWKNIGIRFREYMPVGVRLLLIPVT
ncbi:MAG: hypothetical protein KDI83_17960 [Gammaproteobacteria bacterium]|nr:hypothetical protein [Gammaproteobacteria bacterium]